MAKSIPANLLPDYERIQNDPDLIGIKDDVAVVELRLNQLYQKLEDAYDPEVWPAIKGIAKRMRILIESGEWAEDPEKMRTEVMKLCHVADQGDQEHKIWNEIMDVTDKKANLVKQQWAYLKDQSALVTKEQVAALLTALVHGIKAEAALYFSELKLLDSEVHSMRFADNIALRIGSLVGSAPARPEVVVTNGIPLIPERVNFTPEEIAEEDARVKKSLMNSHSRFKSGASSH